MVRGQQQTEIRNRDRLGTAAGDTGLQDDLSLIEGQLQSRLKLTRSSSASSKKTTSLSFATKSESIEIGRGNDGLAQDAVE